MTREILEKHMARKLYWEGIDRLHTEFRATIDHTHWLREHGLWRRNNWQTWNFTHSYARELRRQEAS